MENIFQCGLAKKHMIHFNFSEIPSNTRGQNEHAFDKGSSPQK